MWKMKIQTKHPIYHQRSSVSKYSITLWWASNTLTIYSEARQINHIFASLNSWKSWLCQFVYLYVTYSNLWKRCLNVLKVSMMCRKDLIWKTHNMKKMQGQNSLNDMAICLFVWMNAFPEKQKWVFTQ